MMVRWFLLAWILLTASAIIQDGDVEKLTSWKTGRLQKSADTPVDPGDAERLGRHYSPNPGDCSIDIADALDHATQIAVLIISSVTDCAVLFRDQDQQELCAADILGILALFAWVLEDAASGDFACSNINVGCEEAAFESMRVLFEATENVAYSADICSDIANFKSEDAPVDSFACWLDAWKVVERLVRAGKALDIAIDLCPSPHGVSHGDKPPTEDNVSTTREPLVSNNQGQVRRHVRARRHSRLGAMPANWSALSQPEPFANLRGAGSSSDFNSSASLEDTPSLSTPTVQPSPSPPSSSSSSSSSSSWPWSLPVSLPSFGPAFPSAPSSQSLHRGVERRRLLEDDEALEQQRRPLESLPRDLAVIRAALEDLGRGDVASSLVTLALDDLFYE